MLLNTTASDIAKLHREALLVDFDGYENTMINNMIELYAPYVNSSIKKANSIQSAFDLANLQGSQLDSFGELLGTPRYKYMGSNIIENNIRVYTKSGNSFGDVLGAVPVIPAGLKILDPISGIGVFTIEDTPLNETDNSTYLKVMPERNYTYNAIAAGTLNTINADMVLSATSIDLFTSDLGFENTATINFVASNEIDDEYRYRLFNRLEQWKTDTMSTIENIMLKFPISQYKFMLNATSFGNLVVLYVPSTIGSYSGLDKVLTETMKEIYPAIYNNINFMEPKYVNVDLNLSLDYDVTKNTYTITELETFISDYVNQLDVGVTFNFDDLSNYIKNITDNYVTSVKINGVKLDDKVVDISKFKEIQSSWFVKFISLDRQYQEGSTTITKKAVTIL